jgi:APA family basic amino acid/polyamine antiporter
MSTLKAFGACLVAVSFTYGGYQQTINFGGEVQNPSKILPKGIFFGIAIIMLLYLTINYTYYKVIGFEQLKGSKSIAAILAGTLFGEKGYIISSVFLFLSVLAYVNVLLMSNPRVMYAMSDEGVLPAIFKKVTIKKNVIMVSLSAFAALCLITLWYGETFDKILDHTIFLDSIGMATSTATIFILRKKGVGEDVKDSYRMKLFPLLPLIFIATYIFLAASIAINTPKAAWVSTLVFAVFFVLYFVLRFFKKKSPQAN